MNILYNIKKKYIYKLPSTKSITNRILIILIKYKKEIKLINLISSLDINIMINSIKFYNKKIKTKNNIYKLFKLKKKINKLNIINSGTTIRLLTTTLSLYNNNNINNKILLIGNNRMINRPIKELFDNLNKITDKNWLFIEKQNKLPILIKNKNKIKIKKRLYIKNNKSSQYLSSILINLINIKQLNNIKIKYFNNTSLSYILSTIKLNNKLKIFNKINKNKKIIKIIKNKLIPIKLFKLEQDLTCITSIYIKCITYNKILIKLINKNSLQGEKNIINIINKYIIFNKYKNKINIIIKKKIINKKIIIINSNNITDSSIIFIILIILNNINIIKIYNIKTWNYKECNRIKALSKEIKKYYFNIIKGRNWLIIFKSIKKINKNILIECYNDHRIAMNFNIIKNNIIYPNCVKKTYPNYF